MAALFSGGCSNDHPSIFAEAKGDRLSDLLQPPVERLLKNEQSRTFFEKFVHNILMYLQILIIGLLVVALMSPFIQKDGRGGRKVLLIDTSASMQHVGASGKSRLEEAVGQACDHVRTAQDTRFSVVTADAAGARILAVDIADTDSLVRTLQGIECLSLIHISEPTRPEP